MNMKIIGTVTVIVWAILSVIFLISAFFVLGLNMLLLNIFGIELTLGVFSVVIGIAVGVIIGNH